MATEIAVPRASELLARMAGRRIVVIGDVMIDEWIWGRVSRISPEAPVPVVAVHDHSFTLGGSGNVASNLRALGADVTFVGVVGDDIAGERVRTLFAEIDCDTAGLLTLDDRPTTRKTRVVAHNQQVVRADWESTAPLREADRARVVDIVRGAVKGADAVVLSDYAKGLLHRDIVKAALAAPVVVADPKPDNVDMFAASSTHPPRGGHPAAAPGAHRLGTRAPQSHPPADRGADGRPPGPVRQLGRARRPLLTRPLPTRPVRGRPSRQAREYGGTCN